MKKVLAVSLVVVIMFAFSSLVLAEDTEAAPKSEESKQEAVVTILEIEPFNYCAIEMVGSYDQHSTGFATLYTEATKQNLPMSQVPFGIYWDNPAETPVDSLNWDIGFKVPEGTEVAEPLKLKPWKYSLMAKTVFQGNPEDEGLATAYKKLFAWVGANGYVIVGPVMERYVSIPKTTEQGDVLLSIELMVPIMKLEKK
ncbi:GyrI-like domain-containing protein [bacterium]|nr:GyrI-like domain-containing protein [bacterium]